MTQDEVDLIYDHLHKNYEYRDGDLVCLNNGQGRSKGRAIGCFHFSHNNGPRFVLNLSIKKKLIVIDLRKAIYIYFHKKCEKYVTNKDGNVTNNKIDNLMGSCRPLTNTNKPQKNSSTGRKGVCKSKGKYVASISLNRSNIFLGNYDNLDDASAAYTKAKELTINYRGTVKEFKELLINHGYGFTGKLPKGVEKNRARFSARHYHNGKRIYIGTYDTPEEAHAAYLKAKAEHAKS